MCPCWPAESSHHSLCCWTCLRLNKVTVLTKHRQEHFLVQVKCKSSGTWQFLLSGRKHRSVRENELWVIQLHATEIMGERTQTSSMEHIGNRLWGPLWWRVDLDTLTGNAKSRWLSTALKWQGFMRCLLLLDTSYCIHCAFWKFPAYMPECLLEFTEECTGCTEGREFSWLALIAGHCSS